uniref:hypothetical protein n=1 Tax=Polaribacter sp. TaxID=1920175 RepID=UPI00404766F7
MPAPGSNKRKRDVSNNDSSSKKKKYAKKQKDTKMYALYNNGPTAIPDEYHCKLKYNATGTITSTSGVPGLQQFRGNSLFDPDFTGTGTQPTSFDELAGLYDFYRVKSSSCTLKAFNGALQGDDIVLVPTNVSSLVGSTNDTYNNYPYAKRQIGSFQQRPAEMSNYISTSKIWGATEAEVMADDTYTAGTGANPSSTWFWTASYQSMDRSTTQSILYTAEIVYYVEFSGRKLLNVS